MESAEKDKAAIISGIEADAKTEEQEIILPNATTVRFFTNWNENDKVLKNSLTYYWTRCANCD